MNLLTKRSVPAMLMALAVTAISVVALLHSLGTHGLIEWSTAKAPPVPSLSNRIADHGTHLVYVPDGCRSTENIGFFLPFPLPGMRFR